MWPAKVSVHHSASDHSMTAICPTCQGEIVQLQFLDLFFLEEIWSIWLLICCIYHRGFHSSVLPWISSGTPAASPWPRTPLSQIWGLARKWNCSDVCHSGPPFSEPRVQQPISLTTLGCDFSIFISSSSWEGKGCIKLSLTNNGLISANILERRRKGSPFFTTIFYDKMFIVR